MKMQDAEGRATKEDCLLFKEEPGCKGGTIEEGVVF